jgi:hypothetical protein
MPHKDAGRIAGPVSLKQQRRTPIPARAAIFPMANGGDYSPPMKPEIFQAPPSLL